MQRLSVFAGAIISGALFFIAYKEQDILFALLGVIAAIIAVLLTSNLTHLNRRISFSFPRLRFRLKKPNVTRKDIRKLIQQLFMKKLGLVLGAFFLVQSVLTYSVTIPSLSTPPQSTLIKLPLFAFYISLFKAEVATWTIQFLPVILTILFAVFVLKLRRAMLAVLLIGTVLVSILSTSATIFFSVRRVQEEARAMSSDLKTSDGAQKHGIITEPQAIVDHLKETQALPTLVGEGQNLTSTILTSLLTQKKQYSSFITQIIFPKALQLPALAVSLPGRMALLPNNTLIIRELDKNAIESVSPTLGRLMVRSYFNPKYIKEEPTLSVMGRQEYLKYREDLINEQLEELDGHIATAQRIINQAYAAINEDRAGIANNQAAIESAISNRDSDYQYCMSAGYSSYYFGFYRYYSDAECQAEYNRWNSIIDGYYENIYDWEQALNVDQANLAEYQKAKDILVRYRDLVETQKDTTPYELGLFEEPSTIKVVLESTSDTALADYLAVLAHEYLHYTSYVSEERSLPQFFEEGLTELFAREIIAKELHTPVGLGYPSIYPIMSKFSEEFSREDLERIYFTKDEKLLISLLNERYGDSFWNDSKYYFQIIPYLGGEDALDIVNTILFKIGGNAIKAEDLVSESSSWSN